MARYSTRHNDELVQTYLKEVGDHPVLSREEERALFQRFESGDESAREEIVRCNLRFVIKIALRYRHCGVPLADLIQEGNLGLLQVIDKFDWRRGFRFSTYAAYYIRQEIQAVIQRTNSAIRLPVRKARLLGKINEFSHRFAEMEGREPDATEMALGLDVPLEKIEAALAARATMVSIDAERTDDGASLVDVIADENAALPGDRLSRVQTRAAVREVLGFLTDREQEVLRLRYGMNPRNREYSLRQASKVVNLSQEGVRRVEQRALRKLRREGMRNRAAGFAA